jgi:hypothetical protein
MLAASASVNSLIAVSGFFIDVALLNRQGESKRHAMGRLFGNILFFRDNNELILPDKGEKWTRLA